MLLTIINDCRDMNAAGRQATRAAALLKGTVHFIGVANDLEASGNLVDMLDAFGDTQGAVLVNVAPRNGKAKLWHNGTPFGYFYYKKILVVASVDGLTLSLVKKLGLADELKVLDIASCLHFLEKREQLTENLASRIHESQFRSYEFLPRAADWILRGREMPYSVLSLQAIADARPCVWWVDNFGNCKTTLLEEEVLKRKDARGAIPTAFGALPYYPRLKDVPDDTVALVTGSSGLENKQFVEIVAQGASAAQVLGISSGDVMW